MLNIEIIRRFFEMPRLYKRALTLLSDSVFVVGSLFLALFVRTGTDLSAWLNDDTYLVAALLAIGSVVVWIKLGLYRAIIRYMDLKVLSHLFWGGLISALLLVVLLFVVGAELPRSIPFIYATIILFFISGSRLLVRGLINTHNDKEVLPVLIYGAGSSGRQLCSSLLTSGEFVPVAFVDDDPSLEGTSYCNVRIFSSKKLEHLTQTYEIKKILFAIPSISKDQKREIFSRVQELNLDMLTIPGNADLIKGTISFSQLRTVNIEDLLGREPVKPVTALIEKCIKGKRVLVTGAGGSIGSELCRQIVNEKPELIVLYELSEFNLYSIHSALKDTKSDVEIIPILGNVQDQTQLEKIFQSYQFNTVYHAAAYKHVPLVEFNMIQGVLNNIWGTKLCGELAGKYEVGHFILVSTDKAVRPTNVMGTTKRMAELVIQDLASRSESTVFSMVRFGNVLGSSGSVIPLFCKQIENGGPVTVTHPEITRYFMTIPEAASLVIQAGALAEGGDVFVLDMGEPVKIVNLAQKMIHLMGYSVKGPENQNGDIEIKYSGLRPGEKLYEELLISENVKDTAHPRIMKANEICMRHAELYKLLVELEKAISLGDVELLRNLLIKAPTGFQPSSPITDIVWLKQNQQTLGNQLLDGKRATKVVRMT